MSINPPPVNQWFAGAIYNANNWTSNSTNVTIGYANNNYLKYPKSQAGLENINKLNILSSLQTPSVTLSDGVTIGTIITTLITSGSVIYLGTTPQIQTALPVPIGTYMVNLNVQIGTAVVTSQQIQVQITYNGVAVSDYTWTYYPSGTYMSIIDNYPVVLSSSYTIGFLLQAVIAGTTIPIRNGYMYLTRIA